MISKLTRLLPLCFAAVLTACFGGAAAVPPRPLASVLPDTSWKLAAHDGAAVPSLVTIRFERDGSVSGLAICNSFSGQARFSEQAIQLSNLTQTLLGCELTGHCSAQETVKALLALERVPARVTPAGLELNVNGRRLLLVPQR
ncbi:MAG TPA: META domain-containing protein [Allosphingosinicella sp.]|jgi:heat shock protein HslJ